MFMKKIVLLLLASYACSLYAQPAPWLNKKTVPAQLMVDGKPFLILGGELGNSTASSKKVMQSVWSHLKAMQLNTVLVPVYWELMEPTEGKFDFTLVDDHIQQARTQHLKIVFLWFGTWKNSMSCYVPTWVKTNATRFERTIDAHQKPIEILSAFGEPTLQADKKAFAALMKHIKQVDATARTVIMIQVENEIGMLGSAREITAKANSLYHAPVPPELLQYLQNNKAKLLPELSRQWEAPGFKASGTWPEVFGKNLATEELFQAWYYARFTNAVAEAGKAQYNIPMYVNAALFRNDQLPGNYPSAGPLPQVMELWQVAAPAIDVLSPDFYNPNTQYWCDLYTRQSNPLFIPEMRFEANCGAKALYVIGHYNALGFSPFAIEARSPKEETPLQKSYQLLQQLQPLLVQNNLVREGVLLDKTKPIEKLTLGGYDIKVSHDGLLPWSAVARDSVWPATGGIIIQTGEDEFIVGGNGIFVTFNSTDTSQVTNILSVDEGSFINNTWQPGRRLNGDEDHQGRHLRIPVEHWGLQRIRLYNTKG